MSESGLANGSMVVESDRDRIGRLEGLVEAQGRELEALKQLVRDQTEFVRSQQKQLDELRLSLSTRGGDNVPGEMAIADQIAFAMKAAKDEEIAMERRIRADLGGYSGTLKSGSAFVEAAKRGSTSAIEGLLKVSGLAYANEPDVQGNSAIMTASKAGYVPIVEQLIDAGVDVDHENDEGYCALAQAAYNGHQEVVEKLLDAGANVDHADRWFDTALSKAAGRGHAGVVSALLAGGAQVDRTDKDLDTALIRAANNGYVEVTKLLIDAGANVDHLNKDRETALMRAAKMGSVDLVKVLLEAQSNVHIQNAKKQTALTLAHKRGHHLVSAMLKDAGAEEKRWLSGMFRS